jgi:outer membrane protein assembly factor BamD (BamD/ComL family)
MEKFSKLMYETENLRDNCKIEKAIELLANYVEKNPQKHYATLVEHRIEYFKGKCHT